MRLIDADELLAIMPTIEDEYKHARKMINNAPTVDPVKQGQWVECVTIFYDVTSTIASVENKSMAFTPEIRKTIYRCSCCGLSNGSMTDYCPHCGTKMDEECGKF